MSQQFTPHTGAEKRAYFAGVRAFEQHGELARCPYENEVLRTEWFSGFTDIQNAYSSYEGE